MGFDREGLEVRALIVNHLLQIEAGLDFGCTGLADEFQITVVNGQRGWACQWLLRKVEEDALDFFPIGRTHDVHGDRADSFI